MSWSSVDARDIPPDLSKLKCHPTRDCKIVVCLLCDKGWCRSDFNVKVKSGKGFYITSNIVVCSTHGDITFNTLDKAEKDDNNEIEIQNKKLLLLTTYIQNIKNGQTVQDIDMDDDLASSEVNSAFSDAESIASTKKRLRDSDMGPCEECANCALYSLENTFLKEMNKELKIHNNELREHNNHLRTAEQKNMENLTPINYSTILSSGIKKNQETVQLVVQPKNNYIGNVMHLVQNEISTHKNVKVLNISKIKNDKIIVKCVNKQDSETISNILQKTYDNNLSVMLAQKKNPQIKVINISSDLDKKQLNDDIINRNGFAAEDFQIVHVYKQKNGKQACIAEVTANTYAKIMKFNSVFVGYENCRALDDFNDRSCKMCCGYGHSSKKCKRNNDGPPICPKCANKHEGSVCSTNILSCINCISANQYLQKKRETQHAADDEDRCETYRIRWERHVSSTNYPWRPQEPFKINKI